MKKIEMENAVLPQKAPGCGWESWGGAFGISDKLRVFDAKTQWDMPGAGCSEVGNAGDLRPRSRKALADYMISLWGRFGNGEVL